MSEEDISQAQKSASRTSFQRDTAPLTHFEVKFPWTEVSVLPLPPVAHCPRPTTVRHHTRHSWLPCTWAQVPPIPMVSVCPCAWCCEVHHCGGPAPTSTRTSQGPPQGRLGCRLSPTSLPSPPSPTFTNCWSVLGFYDLATLKCYKNGVIYYRIFGLNLSPQHSALKTIRLICFVFL